MRSSSSVAKAAATLATFSFRSPSTGIGIGSKIHHKAHQVVIPRVIADGTVQPAVAAAYPMSKAVSGAPGNNHALMVSIGKLRVGING